MSRFGRMRHTVTIQTATEPTDGETKPTLTDLFQDVPAEVVNVRGGEMLRGRQIEATVSAVIRHHWIDNLTPEHAYVYDGNTYQIVAVYDPDERRREIEAQVRKVA